MRKSTFRRGESQGLDAFLQQPGERAGVGDCRDRLLDEDRLADEDPDPGEADPPARECPRRVDDANRDEWSTSLERDPGRPPRPGSALHGSLREDRDRLALTDQLLGAVDREVPRASS